MRTSWLTTALMLVLLPPVGAQEQADPRYLRAFTSLYTTAQLGGLVKSWCDARAPMTQAATDTALAAWKSQHQLDDVEARAEAVIGGQLAKLLASVESRRPTVFRALDKDSKNPEADCRQMLAYLNRSANPQRLNPADFQLVNSRRAAAGASVAAGERSASGARTGAASTAASASTAGAPAAPRATPPGGQGHGTLYTVAQLAAFVEQDHRTAHARLKQLGPLTVQGTLEVYGDDDGDDPVWFNTVRGGWRSRESVRCYDLSFRKLYDAGRRDITIRGTLRKYDNWIVLEDCQLIGEVAGLTPSTLSDSIGLQRMPVKPAQILTAPNAGVAMADIEGIYQPTQLRYNAMSMLYEPDETTYLLLKDGWLYEGLDVTPHDLNVVESRRLEPQHWHRWRRQDGVLERLAYDEYGKTDGKWRTFKVIVRPPIGARRLNGTFGAVSSATAGMVGGGGAMMMARTSYTFRPDGTFSWTNFTQGFGSSTNGTGPGGSTIVVGGATVGPNGTSVSTVGGGEDQGTYTTEHFTLVLRTTSGKVFRFPIFSWDDGKYRDHLVINGTTYSPPK